MYDVFHAVSHLQTQCYCYCCHSVLCVVQYNAIILIHTKTLHTRTANNPTPTHIYSLTHSHTPPRTLFVAGLLGIRFVRNKIFYLHRNTKKNWALNWLSDDDNDKDDDDDDDCTVIVRQCVYICICIIIILKFFFLFRFFCGRNSVI